MIIFFGACSGKVFGNVIFKRPFSKVAFICSSCATMSSVVVHSRRFKKERHTCIPWGSWMVRENLPWRHSFKVYPLSTLWLDFLVSAETVNFPVWKLIWTSSFEKPGNSKVAVTTFFSVSSCRSNLYPVLEWRKHKKLIWMTCTYLNLKDLTTGVDGATVTSHDPALRSCFHHSGDSWFQSGRARRRCKEPFMWLCLWVRL